MVQYDMLSQLLLRERVIQIVGKSVGWLKPLGISTDIDLAFISQMNFLVAIEPMLGKAKALE